MLGHGIPGWLAVVALAIWGSLAAGAAEPCEPIPPGGPGDCDANGFPDECDLAPNALGYAVSEIHNPPATFDSHLLSIDFEPDGDPDLLFFNEKEVLSYTNRGGGAFNAPRTLPTNLNLAGPVAADFDGDSVPDFAANIRYGPERVLIFRGDGAGQFHSLQEYEFPQSRLFAAGDLDGDGRPEIVINNDHILQVGIHSFDAEMKTVLRQVIIPPRYLNEAQLGDFDRDGDLDLFLLNDYFSDLNGAIFIWRNEGALKFTEGPVVEHPDLNYIGGVALVDLDADGGQDVVCAGAARSPRFRSVLFAARNDRRAGFLTPVELWSAEAMSLVTGADFDGDADQDLLVAGGGDVLLLENLTPRDEGAAFRFVREGVSRDRISSLASAVAADVDSAGGVEFVVYARDLGCGRPDSLLVLSPVREPRLTDCDGNTIPDRCDIDTGGAPDRDRDGLPDRCEPVPQIERCPASGASLADCNANGIDDACDVTDPTLDADGDRALDFCQTPGFAFGITGPGLVHLSPGEETVVEYVSRLYPGTELGTEPGLQGWSLGVRAYGCEVVWATTAETDGGQFCEGGPRRYGFGVTQSANGQGINGVVSTIVLSETLSVTVPLDRPALLLRIGVRLTGPEEGGTSTGRLVHENGLRGLGTPITNSIVRGGISVRPQLFGRSITVSGPADSFRRADANADGLVDISDPIHTLSNLFLGGPRSSCRDAADFDDSGQVDLTDAIATFGMLFLGGPRPPAPGKFECGVDPTPDAIGCVRYGACN